MKPRNHTRIITKLCEVFDRYQPTPHQFRYIVKEIRCRLKLSMPNRPKKLPDVMTDSEIYHFLKVVSNQKPMTMVLCNLLLFTGIRVSEARNLDIRDLDFGGNVLKVVRGKGSKDRFVPLPLGLQDKIKIYLAGRKAGYLFAKSNRKPYSKRNLQYIITTTLSKCGFDKDLHTHSLRHTYATLMLRKGLHKDKVQVILGHSSIKTTEIYTRMELGDTTTEVIKLMGYE